MKHLRLVVSLTLFVFASSFLPAATLYWDPDGIAAGNSPATGAGLGGPGNWDQVTALWFNGASDIAWTNANNDDAVFSGTGGTVTLTDNINVGNLFFTNVIGSLAITNATGVETLTLATATIDSGGGEHSISAFVAGANGLTKTGDGKIHLTGYNTGLSGAVAINQGVVSLENSNALGAGAITVASGAALEINGGLPGVLNSITVSATGITNSGAMRNTGGANNWFGAVTLGADGVRLNSDSGTLDFWGGITGSGDLNLFVGGAGNVRMDSGAASPGNATLNLGNGTLTKDGSGVLAIAPAALYPVTFSNVVVNGGSISVSSDANLGSVPAALLFNQVTLNGAGLQTSGTFTINANRGIFVTTNGGNITINSGALTTGPIISSNTSITFNCTGGNATDLFLGAPLNLGTGGYTKTGAKTMNLNGKTSICGKLVITGGNLSWGTSEAFLGTVPSSPTPDAITLDGGALNPSNTQTINGNRGITLGPNGGSLGDATGSGTLTIAGSISGVGSLTKTTSGAGSTVKLTANNTYAGTTTIQAGTLMVGGGGTAGTLGTGDTTDNGTLNFNRSDAVYSYAGAISGTGNVTKSGGGAVTLTGNSIYSGGTTVSAGALLINNTAGSGTGSGAVTVSSGGTLGGNGAVDGAVTINAGGTLAPGATLNSIGALTINNSLSLAGNLTIQVNKALSPAPSNDLIVVTGALNNTGTGVVTVSNLGPALVAGDTFKLFSQQLLGGASMQVVGGFATWNNNLAVDGTISVARLAHPGDNFTSASGGSFVLNGTNGGPGAKYYLLSSTNVAAALHTWVHEATNSFDPAGAFAVTNAILPGVPQKFYTIEEIQ